jgi:hypothetical protein
VVNSEIGTNIIDMTSYEIGRINLWSKTGLLDKCNTIEEKLYEALRWEGIAKGVIAATWGR